MKIEDVQNWATAASAATVQRPSAGCFYGIAIGPESDEGVVYVDSVLLQAGRILPLRASRYRIERAIGRIVAGVSELPTIRRLQLMLFEDPSELAVSVARPNRRHGVRSATYSVGGGYIRPLTIPFSGRRMAQVRIDPVGAGLVDYKVIGRKFRASAQDVAETTLVAVATASAASVAIYAGGVDNAESWDELAVEVTTEDADDQAYIDIEVTGENGL